MVPAPFLRRALPKNSFISAIVPSVYYLVLGTSDLSFEDTEVQLGGCYEYRLVRLFTNGPLSATGYIHAGVRLPLEDRRGAVLLLVKVSAGLARLIRRAPFLPIEYCAPVSSLSSC
ncbi:hypothetical protein HW115_07780 [Verrucomicrobiaceae bacterium N1E253]|uniref:Uncharacterized protein n=1 Tax=Oceaniferula marina TaxID=2748318 RepID=A0A851GDL1_9BACT|nr:hypothetical protein [Oceaniferula marina]NWK55506.1 hypothetical protein [Oceaniferula marina]